MALLQWSSPAMGLRACYYTLTPSPFLVALTTRRNRVTKPFFRIIPNSLPNLRSYLQHGAVKTHYTHSSPKSEKSYRKTKAGRSTVNAHLDVLMKGAAANCLSTKQSVVFLPVYFRGLARMWFCSGILATSKEKRLRIRKVISEQTKSR